MNEDEIEEALGCSKDEMVILVKLMKLHNMSIASAFMTAVKSEVFSSTDEEDYFSLVILLEKIKYTSENKPDVWESGELEVLEMVKEALE